MALWQLHTEYGRLLATMVGDFISEKQLEGEVDLIASHGHTVFHFPDEHFTTQIGDGSALAVSIGIKVACDFRSADVALGGQGTPIVPAGDLLLFQEYNYLLNLGGIANLTVKSAGDNIVAFDICAANQVLNHYAAQKGQEYDDGGKIAASGSLNEPLLAVLNKLAYYQRAHPKSLDNGFSRDVIIPLIERYDISIADKLHTYSEHIATQIALHISRAVIPASGKLLVTGGGAFNTYLIERIANHTPLLVEVPSQEIIKYKEALVMAFLGVLRWRNEPNVFSSVTGSSRDSVGGALYHP
jgi:anhydro-N-acetylmuramic acid kinase